MVTRYMSAVGAAAEAGDGGGGALLQHKPLSLPSSRNVHR